MQRRRSLLARKWPRRLVCRLVPPCNAACAVHPNVRTIFAVRFGLLAVYQVLVTLATLGCASRSATTSATAATATSAVVRPGLDAFVANPPDWARDKRIGLITNVAGIDSRGRNNIDLLKADARIRLTTLFAFEHGLRGDAPAGQAIASGTDAKTGLPVYSL
jgi:uncharacterized protein YbbC (DUF1343 family)